MKPKIFLITIIMGLIPSSLWAGRVAKDNYQSNYIQAFNEIQTVIERVEYIEKLCQLLGTESSSSISEAHLRGLRENEKELLRRRQEQKIQRQKKVVTNHFLSLENWFYSERVQQGFNSISRGPNHSLHQDIKSDLVKLDESIKEDQFSECVGITQGWLNQFDSWKPQKLAEQEQQGGSQ